jgi:hypothetical protein
MIGDGCRFLVNGMESDGNSTRMTSFEGRPVIMMLTGSDTDLPVHGDR